MAKVKTVKSVAEECKQALPAEHEPTRGEIEERAYYRYVDRGRVDGLDGEDWYSAEAELRGGEQLVVREPDALALVH